MTIRGLHVAKKEIARWAAVIALATGLLVTPSHHKSAEAGVFGGAIGGALLGGLIGGRRGMVGGAIIGGVAGGVADAVKRDRKYRKYRRHWR